MVYKFFNTINKTKQNMSNQSERYILRSNVYLHMQSEINRLNSFDNWTYDVVDQRDLAKAGFFCINELDKVNNNNNNTLIQF